MSNYWDENIRANVSHIVRCVLYLSLCMQAGGGGGGSEAHDVASFKQVGECSSKSIVFPLLLVILARTAVSLSGVFRWCPLAAGLPLVAN